MTVAAFRPVAGAEPVPGYRLEAFLGRGGFGEVWKATAPGGFPVALKFLASDAAGSERELRSLRMLQHIRDGHLLSLQGIWDVPGFFLLAMELADGTLADRLEQCRRQGLPGVPRDELLRCFGQAAAGLDYLNEPRHVLEPGGKPVAVQHGDVKPQNLLLVGSTCKLGDFGLLRCLSSSSSQKSTSMTAAYAPPEVFAGKPSRTSDQYSLAVTWCLLRGGRLPFEGGPLQLLYAHAHTPPDLSMLLDVERPAVNKALSKPPDERWPSCAAFVEALRGSGGGTAPVVLPPQSAGVLAQPDEALHTTPDRSAPTSLSTPSQQGERPSPAWKSDRPPGRGRRLLWLAPAVLLTAGVGLAVLWSVGLLGRGGEATDRRAGVEATTGAPRGASTASDTDRGDRTGKEKADAEAVRKQQEYERRLTAGQTALAGKRYDEAITEADAALKMLPADAAALALKKDALAGKAVMEADARKRQDYDGLMTSAKAALRDRKYDEAIQAADEALSLFAADAPALQLRKDALAGRPQPQKGQPYTNTVGMKLAWIEPGSFLMGSPDGTTPPGMPKEAERQDDETPHRVTLTRGYHLGTTLVTQWQWEQVLGKDANHSLFKGKDDEEKKLPVDSVSWYDCVEYCIKLSEKENRKPCYRLTDVQRGDKGITSAEVQFLADGTGYRLPSEAEWEYAARAGTKTAFWCGDTITTDQANYNGNCTYGPNGKKGEDRVRTTPVDFFQANPWGLHDMGGNLYQWCQDWYGPCEENDMKDPVVKEKAADHRRVLRGGSWCYSPGQCRAASRYGTNPSLCGLIFGCRVVLCLD